MRVTYVDGVEGYDDGYTLHVDMREFAALLLALDEGVDAFDSLADGEEVAMVMRQMRSTMDDRAEEEEAGDVRRKLDHRTDAEREHDDVMRDYAKE